MCTRSYGTFKPITCSSMTSSTRSSDLDLMAFFSMKIWAWGSELESSDTSFRASSKMLSISSNTSSAKRKLRQVYVNATEKKKTNKERMVKILMELIWKTSHNLRKIMAGLNESSSCKSAEIKKSFWIVKRRWSQRMRSFMIWTRGLSRGSDSS